MGKSKTDMRIIKDFEKRQQQAQSEWAKKRGVDFPLELLSQQQWLQERHIQRNFWYMKNIFAEGNRHNAAPKPIATDSAAPKPWLPWSYFEIDRDKQYRLMSKAEMEETVSKIEDAVIGTIADCTEGYTRLSLSPKLQSGKSGCSFTFGRAAFMVSPSRNTTKYLYTVADEEISAALYAGCDIKDEKKDAGIPPIIGFVTVTDEDNYFHAVRLEEFSALVEVKEDKGYIFTFYSEVENLLFIKHLTSLENVELFSDRDIAADMSSSSPQLFLSNDDFIGLSKRENEVVKLMLKGMSYIEIAETLKMSPLNLAVQRRKIFVKLQINTEAELFALANRIGFSGLVNNIG